MRSYRCQAPVRHRHALRAGFDLHLVTFEVEDVEVAARDVDCDVVHGHFADRAFEASAVSVPVARLYFDGLLI